MDMSQKIEFIKGDYNGIVYIMSNKLTTIPSGLVIGHSMNLEYVSDLTEIPDNTTVYGTLWCEFSGIIRIGHNVIIGQDLWVNDTHIHWLPDDLIIGGDLVITNTSEVNPKVLIGGTTYKLQENNK